MIRFACPNCGKQFSSADELAGQQASCNRCGRLFTVGEPLPEAAQSRPPQAQTRQRPPAVGGATPSTAGRPARAAAPRRGSRRTAPPQSGKPRLTSLKPKRSQKPVSAIWLVLAGGGFAAALLAVGIVWISTRRPSDRVAVAPAKSDSGTMPVAAPDLPSAISTAVSPAGGDMTPPSAAVAPPAAVVPPPDAKLQASRPPAAKAVEPSLKTLRSADSIAVSGDYSTLLIYTVAARSPPREANVTVWSLKTGQMRCSFSAAAHASGMCASPDGAACACHAAPSYIVYDASTGAQSTRCDDHGLALYGFSSDGKRLIGATRDRTGVETFGIVDISSGMWQTERGTVSGLLPTFAYTPAANLFATAKVAGQIVQGRAKPSPLLGIYQPGTARPRQLIVVAQQAAGLAFSGDGSVLVAILSNGGFQAWNTRNWEARPALRRPADDARKPLITPGADNIAVAPEGKWFAYVMLHFDLKTGQPKNTLEIWDIELNQRRHALERDNKAVQAIALPNSRLLLIGGSSGPEWLDASTGRPLDEPFGDS